MRACAALLIPISLLGSASMGCHLLLPFSASSHDAPRPDSDHLDVPYAWDVPRPPEAIRWEKSGPALERGSDIKKSDAARSDSAKPKTDLPATILGKELTEAFVVVVTAGCTMTCKTTLVCGQSGSWSNTFVWRGSTSLALSCKDCPKEHFVSMSRLSGAWDLTNYTGFSFRMRTESGGNAIWQDSTCHLTPTIVLQDTSGTVQWIERSSKSQPPFPNSTVGAWQEISGPLKTNTTNWSISGSTAIPLNYAAVKTVGIHVADATFPIFDVYFDGFIFTGGPYPFDQVP